MDREIGKPTRQVTLTSSAAWQLQDNIHCADIFTRICFKSNITAPAQFPEGHCALLHPYSVVQTGSSAMTKSRYVLVVDNVSSSTPARDIE